jgi:apolipoprotein D and lipocalin family protein
LIVDIEHSTHVGATGATSRIVAALASALLFVSAVQGATTKAPEPARPVDASKLFTGQWIEIGRRPMKLTDGCVAGGTRYTPVDRTHVDVLDTCHEKTPAGKLKSIVGPGTITDPGTNAKLHVDYKLLGFLPVGRDYWILDHDDGYSWFISSNPNFTDLWIYTRTTRPDPALVKSLTDKARAMGYDVSKLEFPAQP